MKDLIKKVNSVVRKLQKNNATREEAMKTIVDTIFAEKYNEIEDLFDLHTYYAAFSNDKEKFREICFEYQDHKNLYTTITQLEEYRKKICELNRQCSELSK